MSNNLDLITFIFIIFLSCLLTISTIYVGKYIKCTTEKMNSEIKKIIDDEKNKNAEYAITRINEIVYQAVFATEVTTVANIKKETEDGKLSEKDIERISNEVKYRIHTQIGPELKEAIAEHISDLNTYIEDRIEVELEKIKKELEF